MMVACPIMVHDGNVSLCFMMVACPIMVHDGNVSLCFMIGIHITIMNHKEIYYQHENTLVIYLFMVHDGNMYAFVYVKWVLQLNGNGLFT